MGHSEADPTLSMREMSARSGVAEGTLRMWEVRYDFPLPERLPSGHRRYSELDLRRVRAVVQARAQGLSLGTAIDRARHLTEQPHPSVFAALRESFPQLQPHTLPKGALVALSHAIEDEACARALRPLLFGCFQHERFYRAAEARWREMARTAERAIVLADFPRRRRPRRGPAEVPIRQADPLRREWVLVCESQSFAACLVAFERPADRRDPRCFETIWTVEREVVRQAARTCCELIARSAPELVEGVPQMLDEALSASGSELQALIDLTTRMVLYATGE